MVLFMGGLSVLKRGDLEVITAVVLMLLPPLIFLYKMPNIMTIIFSSLVLGIITFLCMLADILSDEAYLVKFIMESICLILLIVFSGIMKKRTKYGTEMLGKIKGFKNFLETAEKPQLEEMVMKEPEYYYNILPYTYVLGVSNKWMKKFEDIALEAPKWYYGYSTFDSSSFNNVINSTYASISTAMASSPSDSSGSGGGSSGGGSGGGGGGSW